MDLEILKKKLNTYRTAKGRLTKVPDELAYEILLSWEQWTGPASGFYSAIGADFRKVAGILVTCFFMCGTKSTNLVSRY
jgi:hypothetical protein